MAFGLLLALAGIFFTNSKRLLRSVSVSKTSSTRFTQYGIGSSMSKATAILRRNGRSFKWLISEFCHVFMMIFLYAVFCLCGAVCDWLCVRLYQTTLNKYLHDKWLNNQWIIQIFSNFNRALICSHPVFCQKLSLHQIEIFRLL